MIKISVIVPVYNVEPYLIECLDSIINQTLKEIEIICIDDCSTDNSYSILEEYKNKDNRIKLIKHEENRGVGPARNSGLKIAVGEYISFIDSDDYIALNFLENLYNTAKKYNSDIVMTNNIIRKESDKLRNLFLKKIRDFEYLGSSDLKNFYTSEITMINPGVWSKLYRRDFILDREIYFLDIKYGVEDLDFNLRVFLNSPKTAFNNNSIYYYRKREDSLITFFRTTESFSSAVKHLENSILYCKKSFPSLIDEVYIISFSNIIGIFEQADHINRKNHYSLLHKFISSFDVKKDSSIYNDYLIIKNVNDYKEYLLYKVKDEINTLRSEIVILRNRNLTLVNKICWFIPIRKLRDKVRNSLLNY